MSDHANEDHKAHPNEDNKSLVGANGRRIVLDSAGFLNLTLGDTTSCQLVYVTPQVTCMWLSQRACKELRTAHLDFQAQAAETGQEADCSAVDRNYDNGRVCEYPVKSEVLELTKFCAPAHIVDKKNSNPGQTVDFKGLDKTGTHWKHLTKAPPLQCQAVGYNTPMTTLYERNRYHTAQL